MPNFKREHALGPTPILGSSPTYRSLLARWLLKKINGTNKSNFPKKMMGLNEL